MVVCGPCNFLFGDGMDILKPVAWMVTQDDICILLTQRELAARQWAAESGKLFPLFKGEEIELNSSDVSKDA